MFKKISRVLLFIFLSFFIIATIIIFKIFFDLGQRNFLKVVFLDVGQGDAIFIESPNGYQVLIDAGPNSAVVKSLSKFIPYYDREINLLIASHSDADHVAGFVDVINRYEINYYGKNYFIDNDSLNSEISNLIEKNKINEVLLGAGDKIIIDADKNIYLEILWPPPNHLEKDNNDNSLVIRVVYDQIEFLLTGDASAEIEDFLVKNFETYLESEVLKLGHHGSKTSTGATFLDLVKPNYAIISAGKDNKFGHPSKEIIDLLQKTNIKILETAKDGSIYFKTDGKEVWLID